MLQPSVSVLLPVLDEAAHIDDVISDLLGQDYGGRLELIVADGGSLDGTLEKAQRWTERDHRLRVIDNPKKRQAHGLNAAAQAATGEVLVRADGHTRYADDYVSRSIEALLELGGAVGGRMNPVGSGSVGRAVAAAMNNPLTMGPARFHHATVRTEADTVYLGAFAKQDFLEVGGMRSFPSGSSEDADFYYRWRRSGRRVFVDPTIVSRYSPRESLGALWRQYWRYGRGKAEMLWANGRLPSWRPLAPFALVIAEAATLVIGLATGAWWPMALLLVAWGAVLLIVAVPSGEPAWRVFPVAAAMHLAYGLGSISGLVRGPFSIRD